MATIPAIDKVLSEITRWSPSSAQAQQIQWSLDARRIIILGNRIVNKAYFNNAPDSVDHFVVEREELSSKRNGILNNNPNTTNHSKFIHNPQLSSTEDYVAIIDIDRAGVNNGYSVIKLPFIPRELEYNIESAFASIKPIGRNNPKYHYTGSEDRLEFEIDWHSFDQSRLDVISNCRKIEALAKGDGYSKTPHRVMIQWGTDNVLFKDHIFIVAQASYKLVQFNKAQLNSTTGQLERTAMLPVQAYQRVVLQRITSTNLTTKEIEYVAPSNNLLAP